MRSRYGYRSGIPNVSSQKLQTKQFSYKDGVDAYSDNDDVKASALVQATDARMVKKGRYKTRRGATRYSVPVGEAITDSITSTTGAADQTLSSTRSHAQKFTASSTGVVTRVDINLKTTATSSGTLLVEIYSDSSGDIGTLLASSSVNPPDVGSSYAYVPVYFMNAPAITSSDVVWVVVSPQGTTIGDYNISSTTSATTAQYRDGATTWTAASWALNMKLYVAPANPIKGVYRAYRFNGLNKTYFAANDSIYSVNDVTGATTSIESGLSTAYTNYRFEMAQDNLFVAFGAKPYKITLSTDDVTEVSAATFNADLLIEHKGLVFYNDTSDGSVLRYTNFGEYETFTSTDFLTFGSPKSQHNIVALAKLNGALYVFARRNKYILLGDSNVTWSIDEAPDQRGTYSQESVVYDENYIWHADQDGIHQFNGTESVNLAENFLEDYRAIEDKESIVLEKWNNRLYVYYTPNGGATNSECFVINLLLGLYEGKDLNTHVRRTFARFAQDNLYIQGSSLYAGLFYGEQDNNNYDNLGSQLQFELRTAYNHFDAPAQLKRIPKWRPVFDPVSGSYSVTVGTAVDFETDATESDVDLTSNNPKFDTGLTYDSGEQYATPGGSIEPQNLVVPGEFKRIQRRYKHTAAHEPVEVDSEALSIEVQRFN